MIVMFSFVISSIFKECELTKKKKKHLVGVPRCIESLKNQILFNVCMQTQLKKLSGKIKLTSPRRT
jgi:hypothetical protein